MSSSRRPPPAILTILPVLCCSASRFSASHTLAEPFGLCRILHPWASEGAFSRPSKVMQPADDLVRRRDDRAGLDWFAALRRMPSLPKPREPEGRLVPVDDVVRLSGLLLVLPLEKTVRHDDAATLPKGCSEGGQSLTSETACGSANLKENGRRGIRERRRHGPERGQAGADTRRLCLHVGATFPPRRVEGLP